MKLSKLMLIIFAITFIFKDLLTAQNCNRTSSFWADNLNFIPDETQASFIVPISIIIVRRTDGTGNFPNDNNTHDLLSGAIDILNYNYDNLVPLNPSAYNKCFDINSGQPSFIPSTKIQFSLENILFVDSTEFWGIEWVSEGLENYVNQLAPNTINVYFTMQEIAWNCFVVNNIACDVEGNNWVRAIPADNYDHWTNKLTNYVVLPNKYAFYVFNYYENINEQEKKSFARMLEHEFGHVLGLNHWCEHYSFNACVFSIMH